MPKGEAKLKKMQLRRCGLCQKTGHNKSTCLAGRQACPTKFDEPELDTPLAEPQHPTSPTVRAPLNFFVHHVQYQNHESPHLVNLKEQTHKLHHDIEAVAPKQNEDFYYFHQKLEKVTSPLAQQPYKPNFSIPSQPTTPTPAPQPVTPKISAPAFSPQVPATQKEMRKNELPPVSFKIKKSGVLKNRLSEKFSRARSSQKAAAKKFAYQLKKMAAPKHLVRASLLFLFLLFVPSTARTYYFDLKSTTNQVADSSTAGFSSLHDSTSALMTGDLGNAQLSLTDALHSFDQAVSILDTKYSFLQKVIGAVPVVNKEIKSRQQLIAAGQEISLGNTYLLKGLSEVQHTNSTLTQNLALVGDHLKFSLPHYQTALNQLSSVDSDILPFEYQDTFKEFRVLFTVYVQDLENIAKLNNSVQEVFGGKGLRRYLLIFQNPAEIRPTGGFMGSFAMIDIKDGNIVHIDIPPGGSYDLQGQLSEYIAPPTPLLLSNKRWEFQDANWFADFPASAQKILWFYRHSRNVTADGVIAINADVLNRLLSILGPVSSEDRGLTLDSNNALATIQDIVEYGPEKKDHKPKQILSDLAPVFIDSFKKMEPASVLPLLANLEEALQQKEIQAYFADANTQKTMAEFGWSGEIKTTNPDQDYLLAVNTNIQGQKSDARISQSISHQAVIQPDGTILDSVVITREHTGKPDEKLYGQTNIDYVRLYVPAGSELVRASGFIWPDEKMFKVPDTWSEKDITLSTLEKEVSTDSLSGTRITNEFGKTAFGNWIITEPGQTTQVQFIYKLPFKAWENTDNSNLNNWAKIFQMQSPTSKYQLIAQKQSGVESKFESQVIYPEGWSPIWKDGADSSLASNGMLINPITLDTDKVWSLVMKKND